MSCNLNDPAAVSAYEEIVRGGSLDWLILGYRDTRDTLSLYASGYNGLEGFKEALTDEVLFGFLRVEGRYLLVTYVGDGVSGVRRARALVHGRAVGSLFRAHQATLSAAHPSDLNETTVRAKLKLDGSYSPSMPGTPRDPTIEFGGNESNTGALTPRTPRTPRSPVPPTMGGHVQQASYNGAQSGRSVQAFRPQSPAAYPAAPPSPRPQPLHPPSDSQRIAQAYQQQQAAAEAERAAAEAERAAASHQYFASDHAQQMSFSSQRSARSHVASPANLAIQTPVRGGSDGRRSPISLDPSAAATGSNGHLHGQNRSPSPVHSPTVGNTPQHSPRVHQQGYYQNGRVDGQGVGSEFGARGAGSSTASPPSYGQRHRYDASDLEGEPWIHKQVRERERLSGLTSPRSPRSPPPPVPFSPGHRPRQESKQLPAPPVEDDQDDSEPRHGHAGARPGHARETSAMRIQREYGLKQAQAEEQDRLRAEAEEEDVAEKERLRLELEEAERKERERRAAEEEARRRWAAERAERERLDAFERSRLESEEKARRQAAERLRREEERRAEEARKEKERLERAERERVLELERREREKEDKERRIREEAERKARLEKKQKEREDRREKERAALQQRFKAMAVDNSGDDKVLLTGSVTVQGGNSIMWRRRWFELHKDKLSLYKNQHETTKPLDVLPLASAVRSITDAYEEVQMANSFKITFVPAYEEEGHNPFLMYCDSKDDKDLLVTGLSQAARI